MLKLEAGRRRSNRGRIGESDEIWPFAVALDIKTSLRREKTVQASAGADTGQQASPGRVILEQVRQRSGLEADLIPDPLAIAVREPEQEPLPQIADDLTAERGQREGSAEPPHRAE